MFVSVASSTLSKELSLNLKYWGKFKITTSNPSSLTKSAKFWAPFDPVKSNKLYIPATVLPSPWSKPSTRMIGLSKTPFWVSR